jgi:hypothetical protein
VLGAAFLRSLGTLELGELEKDLGDLLSDAQIEAVLESRDSILEMCAKPNPDWSWEEVMARGIAEN